MNLRRRRVIAAFALLLSTQAWGTTTGSARMTLQVELIDLDPLDGSAPWVSFATLANPLVQLGAFALQTYPYALDRVDYTGGETWVPEAAAASTTHASAASRFETPGAPHGSTLTSTGTTLDFREHPSDTAHTNASVTIVGGLTLSPNTRLVVTGIGNLSALGTSHRDTMVLDASLRLNRPSPTGGTAHSWEAASFETPIVRTPYVYSEDFVLTTFLVNASALPMAGTLTAYTVAVTTTHSLPIPEPRALDLMVFGLGVLGVSLHRRSRASARSGARPSERHLPAA